MKQLLLGVTTFFGAVLLGGCPIYSSSNDARTCGPNGCFDCPAGSTPSGGMCIPWACSSSSECPAGYTCGASTPGNGLSCIAVTSGSSSSSSSGASDCSRGCQSGYTCKLSGGQTQCVPSSPSHDGGISLDAATLDSAPSDSGGDEPSDARTDAAVTSDAFYAPDALDASNASEVSATSDASDGSDSSASGPCNANGDCGGAAKCINGGCTQPAHLCSDTTQCVTAGEACVDGVCEPHCSASAPCPAGYACDFTRGVCSVNPHPCAGSGTSTCQGGSTCVEARCVAPCVASDAGSSACPAGQVCVNGGCIPDEAAQFTCKNDGQSGQLATTCSATQICLHHDCYAACDPDAGASACADPATGCKQVDVTAGTYLVCATPLNLGSDCDPAAGRYCATGVCVDGYCK